MIRSPWPANIIRARIISIHIGIVKNSLSACLFLGLSARSPFRWRTCRKIHPTASRRHMISRPKTLIWIPLSYLGRKRRVGGEVEKRGGAT